MRFTMVGLFIISAFVAYTNYNIQKKSYEKIKKEYEIALENNKCAQNRLNHTYFKIDFEICACSRVKRIK